MDTKLTITSPAFEEGGKIPIQYTGRGEDVSPELQLSFVHAKAESIAIIMNDIDHPIFPKYNHWVIWNLPVTDIIPENIPHGPELSAFGGAVQGMGYGRHRYRGPKPPFNLSHRYEYHVFVLDCKLDLPVSARKKHVMQAMSGHILQKGSIIGRFR